MSKRWTTQEKELAYNMLKDGYSIKEAAEKLGRSYNTIKVMNSKEFKICKIYRNIPNLEMTSDLAYILGVLFGDGYTGGNGVIALRVADKKFAESFRDALRVIGLPAKIYERPPEYVGCKPMYRAEVCSVVFAKWLKSRGLEEIGEMILNKGKDHIVAFIRGFYESEGSIYDESIRYGKYNKISITMSNSNYELISLVGLLVNSLGYNVDIRNRKTSDGRLPHYVLRLLGSSDVKYKFLEEVNPCIKNST
uniref:Putative homing endonuclease n=1 Tax=viral metagenome TaxID=1070528 RepID=A0A6M3Y1T4_9ZZZZ